LRLQHGISGDALGRLQDLLVIGDDETRFDRRLAPGARLSNKPRSTSNVSARLRGGDMLRSPFAMFNLKHAQAQRLLVPLPCARNSQTRSNRARMSAGARRGATSAQPCRSSAWIIIKLSVNPKFSTVNPDASTSVHRVKSPW